MDDIESFSVGTASAIKLLLKNGEKIAITDMFNKKLVAYMEEAGLKKA